MIDLSKNTVLAIAGVCGTAFVGYCIYFDRKRRSAPDFRQKLKEKRMKSSNVGIASSGSTTVLPDLRDVEAVQKFFIDEVQKGEELLGRGSFDEAVEHLTNAVAVCGQPQQLLQILQQTLPQPVFAMLLERLPLISQKVASAGAAQKKDDISTSATITDVDDLE